MAYDTILYDVAGGVATITFNRPEKLNAFNDTMIQETIKALRDAEHDETVRALIVTGAGRAFSAGQDLADYQERRARSIGTIGDHIRSGYNVIVTRMRAMEKPIVGAVNGAAAGAGAGIALACDILFASEQAIFAEAFIGIALVPDSGNTWFLPRRIGPARAFEMAVTGERIRADEALRLGLVNHVIPPEDLMKAARDMAEHLAQAPTKAIGLTKRAMNRALEFTLDQSLEYEAQLQDIAGRLSDHQEGVAAFLAKRQPKFTGK